MTPHERRLVRAITAAFVVIVACAPLALVGGAWSWLLVPALAAGVFALAAAVRLRIVSRSSLLGRRPARPAP